MEAAVDLTKEELWNMSTSYPAPMGEIETKEMLKTIQQTNKQKPVETEDREITAAVESIPRLAFLSVLCVDIILTSIYIVLTFIVASQLLFQDDPDSTKYAAIMLIVAWIPALLLLPNEIYYNKELYRDNSVYSVIKVIFGLVIFPFLPSVLYCGHLRYDYSAHYISRLNRVNSVKNILHTTLYLILLCFLAMRGKLEVGDNSSSCLLDNLGRSTCFVSSAITSAVISLLLLIRSELNLLSELSNENRKKQLSTTSRILSWVLSTSIYKVVAYAYILTCIDYWRVIPAITIMLVVTVIQEYIFTEYISTDESEEDTEYRE